MVVANIVAGDVCGSTFGLSNQLACYLNKVDEWF